MSSASCITPNRKGGDKPRPYGNLCRGGVYPLPFVISTLAELSYDGLTRSASRVHLIQEPKHRLGNGFRLLQR